MIKNKLFIRKLYVASICFLISSCVWANKFETMSSGVKGNKRLKLDWLVDVGAYAGLFFVVLGLSVLVFRKKVPKGGDVGYQQVVPFSTSLGLMILGLLMASPYLMEKL